MFACIFFPKDLTISVVSKAHRHLRISGPFEENAECVMKWSGEDFDGTILKVGDNEAELKKLAGHLVKRVLCHAPASPLKQLMAALGSSQSKQHSDSPAPAKKRKMAQKENKSDKSIMKSLFPSTSTKPGTYLSMLAEPETSLLDTWALINDLQGEQENPSTVHRSTVVQPEQKIPKTSPHLLGLLRQLTDPQIQQELLTLINSLEMQPKVMQEMVNVQGMDLHVADKEHAKDVEWGQASRQAYMCTQHSYTSSKEEVVLDTPRQQSEEEYYSTPHQQSEEESDVAYCSTPHQQSKEEYYSTPHQQSFITSPQPCDTPAAKPVEQCTPIQSPSTSPQATSENEGMVRLVSNNPTMIKSNLLRKARQVACRHERSAYTLMAKLLPGVFTREELARSRGQGIARKNEADLRPVLDPSKIAACKDYVAAWCKEMLKPSPREKELNFAVTQQVDFSRKQLKKILN